MDLISNRQERCYSGIRVWGLSYAAAQRPHGKLFAPGKLHNLFFFLPILDDFEESLTALHTFS